ncbi:BspA type Leucine rich repeat region (6 copies), putative [Angomonas deanei]|uniref:BspA type Leucine rich repeat region (6 copies), putative n=1 Tax=Angomonas deanei TaxID=59799 RepID=A0A7G2CJ55_9TRYP|nr:BspA type Leucine rich repeat region (6 copies), putative [Angomonas deanei]
MLRCNELYEYSAYFEYGTPLAFAAVSPCARERAESCKRGTLGCVKRIVDGEAWRELHIGDNKCAAQLESVEWWLTRSPAVPLKVYVTLKNDKDSLNTVALLEEFSVRLERCAVHFLFCLTLNGIDTLEPFGTLLSRAERVSLNGCSDLTSLRGLDGLRYLKRAFFNGCGMTDISAIRTCALLKDVTFNSCAGLTSLDALQGLQQLKSVHVLDCPATSLDVLRTCPSLESVTFASCPALTSLDALQGLHHLKSVHVLDCPATSLDVLRVCPSLESVTFASCPALTSLDALQGLQQLKSVHVLDCPATSLDVLRTCPSLESVTFASCPALTSLDALQGLHHLKSVDVLELPSHQLGCTPCVPFAGECYLFLLPWLDVT